MLRITALAFLLSGCAASVVSTTPKNVIVEHRRQDGAQAVGIADAECQRHGRRAVLDVMSCPAKCISQFRCE